MKKITAGSDIHPLGTLLRTPGGQVRVIGMTQRFGYVEYETEPVGGRRWKLMVRELRDKALGIFKR